MNMSAAERPMLSARQSRRLAGTSPSPRSDFEFAQVVLELALQYPQARTIHLVMDNLNIHRLKPLTDLLSAEIGSEVWTGSPFTTRPLTEAGSIRPKSKSASSRGNASAREEFLTSTRCAGQRAPGIAG